MALCHASSLQACTASVSCPPPRVYAAAPRSCLSACTPLRHLPSASGSSRPSSSSLRATKQDTDLNPTQADIQGLERNYCDDFECTSSPAVEQTVRSFANDVLACRSNMAFCQPDFSFTDGMRTFKGREKLKRGGPWYSQITKPKVSISKMQMLDKSTAKLNWRVAGSLGALPVDINGESVIEMNLLTGRLISQRDTLDTSGCSPPASLAVTASRLNWAIQQGAMDAREGIQQKMDEIMPKGDDGSNNTYMDPSDPTKFFQGQEPDKNFDETVTFAIVAAVFWLVYQTYSELAKLP